ncbi:class I SAM-dependent methyltransferase [Actinomadura vinacea]|uniref:Class I SAM-dependent methyltransferase n=1 Tax=Actinomadura vinacea TaxID=115336 RepID=A0ABN3JM63_9ACTN
MRVDTTGKISLDHIYTQPDPRAYFGTLRGLGYAIPQLAKPYFLRLIQEYKDATGIPDPTVLDIGCSYGINAALLKCDTTMDELYERYTGPGAAERSRDDLLERDRDLVRARDRSKGAAKNVRFLGLDSSENALAYAREAGFLDGTVHADLERGDPTGPQRELLAEADLVVSTGCLGYITEKTIARVVAVQKGNKPWMAHFVLRMFPFAPVAETLDAAGYETVRAGGMFKQRRFATAEEQAQVMDRLAAVGVDTGGAESDGWLLARLHISRPRATNERVIMDLAAVETVRTEDRRIEQ